MMSNSWSIFVVILVVGNILAMVWLLFSTSRMNEAESDTTGHTWDGIEEYNNPLPRWWLWLFVITIIFSVVYLYLYPGLGNYAGSLGWTQDNQFAEAKQKNNARQAAFFAEYANIPVPELANNNQAMETAGRLFANNCATCHGSDARGAKGFPNLTDADWLYGSSPEAIQHSITSGRKGLMPQLGLTEGKATILTNYVLSLSGHKATDYSIQEGKKLFTVCASCHGADGKGNQALGAPNLTDDIWLHGSSVGEIKTILLNGKQGNMPSFKSLLTEDEIRLLSAYVVSLGDG